MGGVVVDQTSLPLTGRNLDAEGIAAEPEIAEMLRGALRRLAEAAGRA
jgi:hypothetical protein